MADRTAAFLAQVTAFLGNDYTGEMVLQCKGGRILEMEIRQRIKVAEDGSPRSFATVFHSSTLTAAVGRP